MTDARGFSGMEECLRELALSEDNSADTTNLHITQAMAKLCETIEGDIIPRLLMVFDTNTGPVEMPPGLETQPVLTPSTGSVEDFVDLLMKHDVRIAAQYITTLREDGCRLQDIYLDLLAPAARRFGELWEEDLCSFTQVTVGVSRMHQILHMFSPCFCAHDSPDPNSDLTALIVPMPGEQHTFGHIMVVEFFRRAGWNVWSGAPRTEEEIVDVVSQQNFSVMGLSISADRHLQKLGPLLANIRSRSANKALKILVGGRVFAESHRSPADFGADGSAVDGSEAVQLAAELVKA
ncbi:MAG: cobalamin-dependent protein [Pseudomonadota bacterium]